MYAIAIGSRYYGKTDCLNGLFYVATKFGRINYLPPFPISTYCIWHCDGFPIETRIPLSFMSVVKGILQTWLIITGTILKLVCLMVREVHPMNWILGTLATFCFLIVLLTYLGQKPHRHALCSWHRALGCPLNAWQSTICMIPVSLSSCKVHETLNRHPEDGAMVNKLMNNALASFDGEHQNEHAHHRGQHHR